MFLPEKPGKLLFMRGKEAGDTWRPKFSRPKPGKTPGRSQPEPGFGPKPGENPGGFVVCGLVWKNRSDERRKGKTEENKRVSRNEAGVIAEPSQKLRFACRDDSEMQSKHVRVLPHNMHLLQSFRQPPSRHLVSQQEIRRADIGLSQRFQPRQATLKP